MSRHSTRPKPNTGVLPRLGTVCPRNAQGMALPQGGVRGGCSRDLSEGLVTSCLLETLAGRVDDGAGSGARVATRRRQSPPGSAGLHTCTDGRVLLSTAARTQERTVHVCVALPSPAGTWARLAPTRCEGSSVTSAHQVQGSCDVYCS